MGDELSYGFIMPFFPWIPILAIVCQGILAVWLIHMSLIAWIVAPLWILSGVLIYLFYSRHKALSFDDEIQVLEEEGSAKKDKYQIMLAVANPANSLTMTRLTYLISEAKDARVNFIHMVPVPELVPLQDAETFMVKGRESIMEAMMYFIMKLNYHVPSLVQ